VTVVDRNAQRPPIAAPRGATRTTSDVVDAFDGDRGGDDAVVDATGAAGVMRAGLAAGAQGGRFLATPGDAVAATVQVIRRHHARPTAVLDDRFQRYLGLVHALSTDGTGLGGDTDAT
jgi:uncharacterized membrane protein